MIIGGEREEEKKCKTFSVIVNLRIVENKFGLHTRKKNFSFKTAQLK